jgi:hypothetical protein
MVGILKKIRQILKFVQDNSHLANFIMPGLGPIISSVSALGANVTDRVEKVYNAYQSSKKVGKKFKFRDGVQTFLENTDDLSDMIKLIVKDVRNLIAPTQNRPPEAVKILTKEYGDLHPRLKLKSDSE